LALTKADKLSQIERARQKKIISEIPLLADRKMVFFSAMTGEGKDDLWKIIQQYLG
jgi:GTP-binding protein